jgi:hypothetical protein
MEGCVGRREKLLGAKPPTERVYIAALDETFIVRGMTGVERDAFEASCFEGRGRKRDFNMRNLRSKMVAYCVVEEDGSRTFSDADVIALGEARADVIDRLFGIAQRLSGMRDEDVDELGIGSATTPASATGSSATLSN